MIECNCCNKKCNVRMIDGKLYDIDNATLVYEKEIKENDPTIDFLKSSLNYLIDCKVKSEEEKEVFSRLLVTVLSDAGSKNRLLKTQNDNYFLTVDNQIIEALTLDKAKDYLYQENKILYEAEFGQIEYA